MAALQAKGGQSCLPVFFFLAPRQSMALHITWDAGSPACFVLTAIDLLCNGLTCVSVAAMRPCILFYSSNQFYVGFWEGMFLNGIHPFKAQWNFQLVD